MARRAGVVTASPDEVLPDAGAAPPADDGPLLTNPGNFPEELSERTEPATETVAPDAEPELLADEPVDEWRTRFEELDGRYSGLEKELEFLRRGQQQPTPQQQNQDGVDPFIQQALAPLTVRADVLESLGIPATDRNVQIVGGALQAAALIGSQIAEQRLLNFYRQEQERQATTQSTERDSNALRDSFWKDHADLEPYKKVVRACAQEVAQEMGDKPGFNADWAKREVARRARAELRQYGVNLPAQAASQPGRPARLRPATAEMGGNGRVNGNARGLTATQRQMEKLIGL